MDNFKGKLIINDGKVKSKEREFFIEHTQSHIDNVKAFLLEIATELIKRGLTHDQSKFTEEEASLLELYVPKLKQSVYMSDEYMGFLEYLKPALSLHYKRNRHHPEYFKKGFSDMSLIDILELLADWRAATLNHSNGDLMESIRLNQKRFGYSDEIKNLLLATVRYLGWVHD